MIFGLFGGNKKRSAGSGTRHKSKPNLARFFQASTSDRLTEKWTSFPVSADQLIRDHQRILVARSREQAANNDYARKFIRLCTQNVVGSQGIILQAQSKDPNGKLDTLANDAIEWAWYEWGKKANCDVTGVQSFRSIQANCIATAIKDGEFMIRIIRGADAGPWGIALQLIDPVRCPVQLEEQRLVSGNFIRQGIEFTPYGKPVAYYFSSVQEDATYTQFGYSNDRSTANLVRVPADEIIHGFLPEIVGQKRGLPWMATALYRMKMLHGFEDAALVNARVSASKMGFFEWDEGYGPQDEEVDEVSMEVEPGLYRELPPGVRVKEINPNYPNGELGVFSKSMLRGIASGLGVSYNNLANDLEGVNYSSIRQGTLDERDYWKELQQWFVESLMEPVFEAWLPIALLSGKILVNGKPLKPERLDKYKQVDWQPRRWQWIDPVKDVNADVESKNNLLMSPGQIIREQGRDPDAVWREIAGDIVQMKAAGIPEEFIKAALGQDQKQPPDQTQSKNQKETKGNGSQNKN